MISTTAAAPRTQRLRVLLPAFATAASPSAPSFSLPSVSPAGVSTAPAGSAGGRPVLLTAEVVEVLVLVPVAASAAAAPAGVVSKTAVSREVPDGGQKGMVNVSHVSSVVELQKLH